MPEIHKAHLDFTLIAKCSVLSSATKQSVFIPKPLLNESTLPSQAGRVFLITGANTGVGYELARILFGAGGTVCIACRSEEKAREAIASIKAQSRTKTKTTIETKKDKSDSVSAGRLEFVPIHLSDLRSVKSAAATFLAAGSRLDILWNNAGVAFVPPDLRTPQNHDLTYGTNVLGPFLLAQLLAPLMRRTASRPSTPSGSVRVCWPGSIIIDLMALRGGISFAESGPDKQAELVE